MISIEPVQMQYDLIVMVIVGVICFFVFVALARRFWRNTE